MVMCLTEVVYCWHCGKTFKKKVHNNVRINDFENCPHCGKGFNDLCKQAQEAVIKTLETVRDFRG